MADQEAPTEVLPAGAAAAEQAAVAEARESAAEREERVGFVKHLLRNLTGEIMKWPHARLIHKPGEAHEVILPADQAIPQAMQTEKVLAVAKDGTELPEETPLTPDQEKALAIELASPPQPEPVEASAPLPSPPTPPAPVTPPAAPQSPPIEGTRPDNPAPGEQLPTAGNPPPAIEKAQE